MAAPRSQLLLVTESGAPPPDVVAALRGHLPFVTHALDRLAGVPLESFGAVLADIDLNRRDVATARAALAPLDALPRLFIVDAASGRDAGRMLRQLDAVGALMRPLAQAEVRQKVRTLYAKPSHEQPAQTAPAARRGDPAALDAAQRDQVVKAALEGAITAGGDALATAFEAVTRGGAPRLAPIAGASQAVVSGLTQAISSAAGISQWLDAVRSHHSGTFRHSLTVTANAVLYGLHLGLGPADLERLAMAGLLHDIGKAVIPLEILDKPGRLDPAELRLIQRHPQAGRELLLAAEDPMPPDIIAAVAQHHEYLDGTGYPEGLKGDQIADFVRIITIADIFTALVEERSYKAGMPPLEAARFLEDRAAAGKLDPVLVAGFVRMVEAGEAARAPAG